MNSENFTWQLIARSLSGEASADEVQLLLSVLAKDELLQQQYDILKQFWSASNTLQNSSTEQYEKNIEVLLEKSKTKKSPGNHGLLRRLRKPKRNRSVSIIFGSSLCVLILSLSFYFFHEKSTAAKTVKLNQVVVKNGNRNRIVLPDGSVVWLNGGSSIYYGSSFSGKAREVYLKGEAFFDVVKKAGQPFIVHANGVDIKVLGTAFNVKSYIEDNKVEATLIRGVIQVIRQDDEHQKPVFLHPNEKLVISLEESKAKTSLPTGHLISKPVAYTLYHLDSAEKTENRVETSWMYNRLEFRGDNFKELAKKLEHWYNIKIVFEDSIVEQ
ncbi:MAG: FecR family protein, partial [Parafilimonas sp.]|nr:FecR family protein [Parafilimonas sp.]